MNHTPLFLAIALSLALAACGQEKQPEVSGPAETAAPAAEPMAAEPAQEPSGAMGAAVDGHALYAAKCASCHGEAGEGLAGNPKLAGLTRADIQSRLADYRAGKQMGPKTAIMAGMAKSLTDEQIVALASYVGE
ncbi:MAG: c-type cytochrome [Hydrogenophilaceae bacterium]